MSTFALYLLLAIRYILGIVCVLGICTSPVWIFLALTRG
jgi:hypothetical protein